MAREVFTAEGPVAGGYAVAGRPDLIAVPIAADAPPRPEALGRLAGAVIANLSLPVAHAALSHSSGRVASLLCTRPGGPALGAGLQPDRTWTESELIARVLRPAVATLTALHALRVPHRAIRLERVFARATGAVMLGEGWSAPPAYAQPAWMEPPYVAVCHPAGRGDGQAADDVYALGALLVLLARGGDVPLSRATHAEVVAAKIEHGSLRAMTGGLSLPTAIMELVRGMLADDPDHRPALALLADPDAARARRVAATPTRRAHRPLEVGGALAWDARMAAHLIAREPESSAAMLADGRLERWTRQSLGDSQLAVSVEALRAPCANGPAALTACRIVALLDPLAPLSWAGLRFWPDGAAPLLGDPSIAASLIAVADADPVTDWADQRRGRASPGVSRMGWRAVALAVRGGDWGLRRGRYRLNPAMACGGALGAFAVLDVADVLPALELMAGRPDRPAVPLDPDGVAFVVERGRVIASGPAVDPASQLALLTQVQRTCGAAPAPGLTGWLAHGLAGRAAAWPGHAARLRLTADMEDAVRRGALTTLHALLFDRTRLARDRSMADRAQARIAVIDGLMAAPRTARTARATGREIAVGLSALFAAAWTLGHLLG